jgi:hypothetical protein
MARYLESLGTQKIPQNQLHSARQPVIEGLRANPETGAADAAPQPIPIPVRTGSPESGQTGEPVPIWLAVLEATSCEANRNGEYHAVRWKWDSGRAVYTNSGKDAEHIEPLGVRLKGGHTMAVYWMPGETAYTVEVYRQTELCA